MHFRNIVCVFPVHRDDIEHGLMILFEFGEGAFDGGQFGTDAVGGAGHDGGNGRRPGAGFVGIIRQGQAHHEAAEVGVTQAQRAELMAVIGDGGFRIAAVIDENFLSNNIEANRPFEAVDIERAVFATELHQVQ